MASVIDQIRGSDPTARQQFIIDVFVKNFGTNMQDDPQAWRGKFRKMAASAFAFYRGSAALFYADMANDDDPFVNEQTGRVWIQGDLHAENFGTYMNSEGILVFDVNDFDEAYVGPFTWDLKRLVASLSLLGYQKALSDNEIQEMISTVADSYFDQVKLFSASEETRDFALTLENTTGKLQETLLEARLKTRVGMLDYFTRIENYDRCLNLGKGVASVDDETIKAIHKALEKYYETIPARKRFGKTHYHVKDIVVRKGMGIGSAGLPSYTILLEGPTQALENDIIIYMKQSQPASPSRVISDAHIKDYFQHDGHRTVISQRALQAYADPWLGYTTLNGLGQMVAEVKPNESDLEWDEINEMDEILEMLNFLGSAVAKIHCVSDQDSDQTLVTYSTDQAIRAVLKGRRSAFLKEMVTFGEGYGSIVRDDYRLFVDAFRNNMFPGLA